MKRAVLVAPFLAVVALTPSMSVAARSGSALPVLSSAGIGRVTFGVPQVRAVASLSKLLGKPSAKGISRACGPKFTEVAWRDLIAEFRKGAFTGYRFVEGGWPVWTSRSLHPLPTGPPLPPLKTALGITLGSSLGEVRSAYARLKQSGAVEWTAPNGLRFIEASNVANTRAATNKIVEIHIGTCGTDQ